MRRLLLLSTALMLPSLPACAQEATAGLLPIIGGGIGVVVLALAGVAALLARRLGERQSALNAAQADNQRLAEMVAAAPDGFYRWNSDGSEHCSRRLAVLLALPAGTDSTWADVQQAFGLTEAAELQLSITDLRDNGVGFEIDVGLKDGVRRVRIIGVRAANAEGEPLADVVWMRDVTDIASSAERMSLDLQDLSAERDRLQALLDTLPMPVWLRDDDLALLYCNRAYARAVDREDPDDVVEHGIELAPAPSVREARALAARARAAGTPRSDVFHMVIDGSRRLIEVTEAPLAASDFVPATGAGMLTAGVAIDRTDQEEVQNELTRHVSAQAEVLEHLDAAIAIFSADQHLSFYNTAWLELWGLDADWLEENQPTYSQILDLLRERRRLPESADFRAYRETELKRFHSIESFEDLLHLPDETTLRRFVSPHPFGGLLFIYEDVTKTLTLERTLNTTQAVHRAIFDNLHEGVAIFGGDGRLRLCNPVFANLWELNPRELETGPHITEIIESHRAFFSDAGNWPQVRDGLVSLFTDRTPRHGCIERADGRILDYASAPLPDGAVLLTWLDVSDSARVDKALRERTEALAAADRLKQDFIASASAELRRPLTSVIGFSEVLANEYFGKLNPRQLEYAHGIAQSGRSMIEVLADILDLASIEAGQMTLHLRSFDVHQMMVQVLAITRERVRDAGIRLNFDCPPDIGSMVGDERRLKQALFNLITNATKFAAGAQLTVAALRQPADGSEEIVFVVADTGPGISAEEQARVFDSFTRGTRPEARQTGAGLGLTLVRRFVELHAGHVEIVSVPGEGTTVTCHVPAGG